MKTKFEVVGAAPYVEIISEIMRRFAARAHDAKIGNGGVRMLEHKTANHRAILETDILPGELPLLKSTIKEQNEILQGSCVITLMEPS